MSKRYVIRFLVRRVAAAVALLVLLSFGAFCLLQLAPGNPVDTLLAGRPRTPAIVRSLEATYHLTGPFLERYADWAGGAIHLDFGQSVTAHEAVANVLSRRAPLTIELALFAFVLVLIFGVPLGIIAAARRTTGSDRAIVGASVVGVGVPPFVTGILLIDAFAVSLGWLPSFGPGSGGAQRLQHLVLPAIALALTAIAIVVRVTRAAMIRELEQDYVVFARARGVPATTVIVRHALRNALIPLVTAAGLVLGYMITGAVLVEQVFALPGIGSLLVSSANSKDLPTLQGVVLVVGVVIIGLNLLTDLLYLVIDPRVRFGASEA